MNTLFNSLFSKRKPLIAMAHLPATPGTPLYPRDGSLEKIVDEVREDLRILMESDFDAVMFCNEADRPYVLHAEYIGVAAMTRVVCELAPRDRPFGVDFLWDAEAALAIAVASGASFIREVTTGYYESDMGAWNTHPGDLLRDRRRLGAEGVAVFSNITPEFASPMGQRSVGVIARSVSVSCIPDAILISGRMAGAEPDLDLVRQAKDAVGDETPILVNTGVKATNVASFLRVADGIIVGSDLKYEGCTWNRVDPARVRRFLSASGR